MNVITVIMINLNAIMTNITAIMTNITAIMIVIIAIMTTRKAIRNGFGTREIQPKRLETRDLYRFAFKTHKLWTAAA